MSKVRTWILATRPQTLILSISPVCIGACLSLSEGIFNFKVFLFTVLTSFCIQIGTNLANDYFDYKKGADSSSRKGPLRVTQAGLVSIKEIKAAILLTFFLSVVCGSYLIFQGGLVIAGILVISILLGVVYTGGPYPLAYLGLGELFVLPFFGPIAVGGTYFLQTHSLSKESIVIGLAPGLLSTAVLTVNNLRDYQEDKIANKNTLIVRFGEKFGKAQYTFCLLCAFLLPLLYVKEHPFALFATALIIPAIPLLKFVFSYKNSYQLNALFPKTAQISFLYTLLFCIGWMIK